MNTNLISKIISLACFVFIFIVAGTYSFIKLSHPFCKQAIVSINNYAVCKTHGIEKEKCKIKANYCGEDKYFYIIRFTKDGKEIEEHINKDVVNLISFLQK